MRIILIFLIGLLSSFYFSELIKRILKRPLHSIVGIIVLISGLGLVSIGRFWIQQPIDLLLGSLFIGIALGMLVHHFLSERYFVAEKAETAFMRRHVHFFERALEIMPGALTWLALTSPIWLSFTLPFAVAYLILIAQVYWLINALKIAVLIIWGYRRMDWARKQPWFDLLQKDFSKQWEGYYHLIVLPTYKETIQVLAPAFDAIAESNYPKKKIFLAVGFEERDDPEKIKESTEYLEKFAEKIGGVFTTVHPFGLEGEVPGPGTNRNWMINHAVKEFEKKHIKAEDVLVTTLDADFVLHKEFLAGATHKYLSTPTKERDKRSYTGVFLYYNNYWQAPTPMRLIATGTAFWQMAEMVGSDKYMNYSSMTINLQSLKDIGGWMPDKVNDDSGFYWKAYFHFKGDYKVIPHFVPISADAVLDTSLWKTFQNQYLQLKRWAYGVEHIPYVFREYFKRRDIDFWDKTDKLLFVIWANLKWGTLALFITFAGLLIPYINPSYSESAVAINLPIISSYILTAAFLGLFATIYVHEKTAPKRPEDWPLITRAWSYIQWLLIPVVLISISTLPAIDAQTSLMFGRYLEFRVTNKARLTT